MSLAAHGRLVEAPQHFQRVAKVTAGFPLPYPVPYRPGRRTQGKKKEEPTPKPIYCTVLLTGSKYSVLLNGSKCFTIK